MNSPLRWTKPRVPSSGSTQKKRLPSSGYPPGGGFLLGEDGYVREGGGEALQDDRFGVAVGDGDGRAVRFVDDFAAFGVDTLNLRSGGESGFDQDREEVGSGHRESSCRT